MFERRYGGEYNEVVAAQRAREDASDPMKRVREAYPGLFTAPEQYVAPKGEYAERALARRTKETPATKKTSTWKLLMIVTLGAYLGNKAAQDHHEYTPPPQHGFSNTMPYSPLLESRPNTPAPEDAAALDALVDSLTAEDKAEKGALAQAFLQNFQDVLRANQKAFEMYGVDDMTIGAFYNAMRKNNVDISNKDAVGRALRDEKIVSDAYSNDNFLSVDEETLKSTRKEFIEMVAGKEV